MAAEKRPGDFAPRRIPLPDPPCGDLGLAPLDGLSDLGRLSLMVLVETERFTGSAIGEGGDTPVEVEAWRALLREQDGGTAFRYLVRTGGSTPATLFGLCGLWFTDRAAFDVEIAAAMEDCGDWAMPVFIGCILDERPVTEILAAIEDGSFPREFRGEP